jgi:hypothetical protein
MWVNCTGIFRQTALAMASAGFKNRFLVCQTECYLVAKFSFLSSQPAFAIADVGMSCFFSFSK